MTFNPFPFLQRSFKYKISIFHEQRNAKIFHFMKIDEYLTWCRIFKVKMIYHIQSFTQRKFWVYCPGHIFADEILPFIVCMIDIYGLQYFTPIKWNIVDYVLKQNSKLLQIKLYLFTNPSTFYISNRGAIGQMPTPSKQTIIESASPEEKIIVIRITKAGVSVQAVLNFFDTEFKCKWEINVL